jgi:hypothetical protein
VGRWLGLPTVFAATAGLIGLGLGLLSWMMLSGREAARALRPVEVTIEGGEA